MMRRRSFLTLLGGATAAWPMVANAQQTARPRRIALLMNYTSENVTGQSYVSAFQQSMIALGWRPHDNLRMDLLWGGNDRDRWRRNVAEAMKLELDAIFVNGAIVFELQRVNVTVPIIFASVIDPVGAGVVASLSRPGGIATGFVQFDYTLASKWVQLLGELVPDIKRIAVLRDAAAPAGIGQWAVVQASCTLSGIEAVPIDPRNPSNIENGVASFAREPNGGLIATVGSSSSLYSQTIIDTAARHRLPTIYSNRTFAASGGLVSYGTDLLQQYRRAAEYVDRVLKGEKPADLPVQTPTKYELVINLRTARTLGLTIPPTLLARADEVIE
jgi:putative ABC transport system substrate-binding protein